jgi:hypothetical protein
VFLPFLARFLPFFAREETPEQRTPTLLASRKEQDRLKRVPSAASSNGLAGMRREQSLEFYPPLELHHNPGPAQELLRVTPNTVGGDMFRANFLQRLASSNVLVPRERRAPKHQQVTIFDWDDTLLPTSALQEGWAPSQQERSELEAIAIQLIEKGLTYGRTFIITNAVQGWVEHSAGLYYPRLASEVLPRIDIISARTDYEANFPGDHNAWKVQAFLEVRSAMRHDIITNLISIGDSQSEMHAVHAMATEFPEALVKTVKLCEQPTAPQLLKQIELILSNFDSVATGAKDMSVSLQPVRSDSSVGDTPTPQSRVSGGKSPGGEV